ncbi:methyltransferase domain-containing protein [Terriglobus sp. TAA 43]|uniref:methyltransferase domain-containing protein n=1 Tax=Terriglobus sp. TAA 43 TaxID=278961 RepID=UPI00068F633C|nr:methyltransferase domain-containing protein [Terriglobus sp. TAA 43]
MKTSDAAAPTTTRRILEAVKRPLRRLLGKPQPPNVKAKHDFDIKYGVDTSGLVDGRDLHSGHQNDQFITAYFGVPPSRLTNAFELWQRTTQRTASQYRFIDVGCGKGRAILLASQFGFRDIFGIELQPNLAEIASENVQRWRERESIPMDVSILCGDGPSLLPQLLAGPVLIYLYNPFQGPVLKALLDSIIHQSDKFSGPIDVLYLYPEYEDVFSEFPRFQKICREEIGISEEDRDDGLSAPLDPCSLYRIESQGTTI